MPSMATIPAAENQTILIVNAWPWKPIVKVTCVAGKRWTQNVGVRRQDVTQSTFIALHLLNTNQSRSGAGNAKL